MIDIVLYFLAALGFIAAVLIDKRWFTIDYKKVEKGFEALEHYHWGLIIWIIAVLTPPEISYFLLGLGFGFIYSEAHQQNYFAHTSSHFFVSTVIGAFISAILIIIGVSFYYNF